MRWKRLLKQLASPKWNAHLFRRGRCEKQSWPTRRHSRWVVERNNSLAYWQLIIKKNSMFSLSILQPHRFFGCSFEMEPSEVFAADFFTSVVGSDLANQTFDRFSLQFGDLLTHMFQAVRETCVLARKKENRICARRPTSAIPKAFFCSWTFCDFHGCDTGAMWWSSTNASR